MLASMHSTHKHGCKQCKQSIILFSGDEHFTIQLKVTPYQSIRNLDGQTHQFRKMPTESFVKPKKFKRVFHFALTNGSNFSPMASITVYVIEFQTAKAACFALLVGNTFSTKSLGKPCMRNISSRVKARNKCFPSGFLFANLNPLARVTRGRNESEAYILVGLALPS